MRKIVLYSKALHPGRNYYAYTTHPSQFLPSEILIGERCKTQAILSETLSPDKSFYLSEDI